MGIGDVVDAIGDGIEHGVETMGRGIGKVVDGAAHVVGDGLDAVGLHGAAEAVDGFGDSVADHLDAQVGELQLGQTEDPARLVHGDVGAINGSVGHLKKFATAFEETADGLRRIDTAHWNGAAAKAFRARYDGHPRQWSDAHDACAQAAAALDDYAYTVQWAQRRAAEAILEYEQAKKDSEQACDTYNSQVRTYNSQVISYNTTAQSGGDPGPVPQPPGEFHDPGLAGVQQAKDTLDDARRQRDSAAEHAKTAVDAAAAKAPAEPRFTDRMLNDASDVVQGVEVGEEHLLGGVLKGAGGIVKFVRGVNPLDPYNITHPAAYLAGLSGTVTGLMHAANHPVDLVKGLVGDGWGADPFEALGRVIPNVALAVGTDGAGAAESLGERAAVDAGERGAVDVGEQTAQVDRLGAAADHNVDLSGMTEAPVWRDSAEPLYRADSRDPSQIFRDGFQPKNPADVDLKTFVQTNNPSAFVSTSTDAGLYQKWGAQYRYDIEAPGGIDVNKTLGSHIFESEKEIAFPGGVDPRFVKGANRVNADGSLGEWIPNPGFNPR